MLENADDRERVDPPGAGRSPTRARMLDAAEALFARSGFDATSVRDVAARAGTSPGSINYYFGSKAGLIRAVLARVAEPMIAERMRRLDAIERAGATAPLALEDILRSFFEPQVDGDAGDRLATVSRLLAHVAAATDERLGDYWLERFGAGGERYLDALERALPQLAPAEVFARYQYMLAATYDIRPRTAWFRGWTVARFGAPANIHQLDQLLASFCAMFRAPPSGSAAAANPNSNHDGRSQTVREPQGGNHHA